MKYNPETHHRHSLRLRNHDYSQPGAYFITIATYRKEMLFGQITNGIMTLTEKGKATKSCWEQIPLHFPGTDIDSFVIMPNHIHGIIVIKDEGTACCAPTNSATVEGFGKPTVYSVPTIIRSFKSAASRKINELHHSPGAPVWQRNYYEHVIRNENDLDEIRQYISDNPLKWALDRENPANLV